ncbi:MAG: formate--tetrahydrofolate ligase, partial [Planctomycetaceae bacterium]|nr:formate--tetrahydrofolate ligase [Planctomycetaceae bacterium]
IATKIYGAEGVDMSPEATDQLELYRRIGFGNLPVCIAKTQYSLSHDPKLIGRPEGFRIPIRQVRLAAGAGFLYALAGEIQTMPGLPSQPAAFRISVDADGTIHNLL